MLKTYEMPEIEILEFLTKEDILTESKNPEESDSAADTVYGTVDGGGL